MSTTTKQHKLYHTSGVICTPESEIPTVPLPATDWLCDSAVAVLELIRDRLEIAPTEKERQILDDAAEGFFQALGV